MARNSNLEIAKPDVAGAMLAVRGKKSRAQIKAERFGPFVDVVDIALAENWSWSAIVTLIRKHDGPSVTKKEAEELYALLKIQRMRGVAADPAVRNVASDKPANTSHADAKDTVST
ncbi:hypothetical protein [Trinickia dinghuensis]|uniref:Uncharacterized protein n=1 Tax=Trinickia dinghuensis TaxID=2291023 RepID=A0A3D8K0B6_9BURK|nr:hypothetical protein [Trinickia dinghuensis]RDU98295.1 hypothetical protein DWV00_13330 [Trinickia dinghuensis]